MSKKIRILIVDDEEDLAWGIAKNLARTHKNFKIECANTGDAALQLIEKKYYDLVVSDFRMPGRNGLDLLMDIRRRYPQTKFILMTAYGSQEIEEQADKRGSYFYIEKPFEMAYLKQLILEALNLQDLGFRGSIFSSGIRELIEFICKTRRTSSLIINKEKQTGRIYFKNGEITHAECGNLSGEKALLEILNWEKGRFKMIPNVFCSKRSILRDWKKILHHVL